MANNLQYFDIEKGLEITPEGVSGTAIRVFVVTAAPGASGDTAAATQGSMAIDYSAGDIYYKDAAGSGTDKWKMIANTTDSLAEISWREPVVAHEDTLTTIPTGITWPATIDGYSSVNIGDRVLFSAISGGDGPNVYLATGTSPNGTYVEAPNDESAGDRVYVINGSTYAGDDWSYNAAGDWVLARRATDTVELGWIRDFIGKTAAGDLSGTEPNYTSNNHITDTDDLVVAASKLDAQIGAELTLGNYIAAGDATNVAIEKLDQAISDAGDQISTTVGVSTTVTVDSVPVAEAAVVEWLVFAKNGANVRSWFVTATHDGDDTPTEASNTDRAVRTRLVIGTLATSVSVILEGGSGGENISLQVTTTPAVDIKVLRRIVKF